MTEVLHSPSSSSSSSLQTHQDSLFLNQEPLFLNQETYQETDHPLSEKQETDHPLSEKGQRLGLSEVSDNPSLSNDDNNNNGHQLSLLALLLALFRKSFLGVSDNNNNKDTVAEERLGMEIGWPTDVRHVAHVTFDRFNGFLGLPVEFEPEVLRRAPSASATVFGVSTESMQLSYDSRGNSVPVILILMQQRLYSQGGLQAEGIFRINADNNQEEDLRNQLNSGVIPDGIDVHCLAGLIKAWFRELPTGVLDPLEPQQVIGCKSEDDCVALCRLLPPTETALLDWAINLMADVVQYEHLNKMNSHNIAMVFAPNMTQMADPVTALMYAVQVMNFLKTLITRTLRERVDSVIESSSGPPKEPPSDENSDQGPRLNTKMQQKHDEKEEDEHEFITDDDDHLEYLTSSEESDSPGFGKWPIQSTPVELKTRVVNRTLEPKQMAQSSNADKSRTLVSNLSSISSQTEKIQAWR